jgi:hypothetical protein
VASAALAANPDILEAEAMVSKATHGVSAAKTDYIPEIGLFGGHFFRDDLHQGIDHFVRRIGADDEHFFVDSIHPFASGSFGARRLKIAMACKKISLPS